MFGALVRPARSYTLKEDLVEVVSPEPRWGVNNTLVQAAPGGPQSSLLQMIAPDLRFAPSL